MYPSLLPGFRGWRGAKNAWCFSLASLELELKQFSRPADPRLIGAFKNRLGMGSWR